jgi:anaerobic magnesium-protoporphyrin IX monomethyl ester cyclase
LLISPSYNRRLGSGIVPSIGLAYIASFLRSSGFTPHILDCSLYFDDLSILTLERMKKWLRKGLLAHRPRFAIGIGPCTTPTVRSIQTIAETCRETYPTIPLIFGGPLAMIPGQEWLFFKELKASAIVKGDGEFPLRDILVCLRECQSISGIPGVQVYEDEKIENFFVQDLDKLPYPAWDIFELGEYKPSVRRDLFVQPFAPIIGSRGCPFNCGFCVSGQYVEYRRQSYERTAAEAGFLRKNFGIRSLIFYDDALFSDKRRMDEEMQLFATLITKKAPDALWQIEIRPDLFSCISEDTFEYVYARGCRQMNIGVEKSSEDQLRTLHKPYNTNDLREACNLVSRTCPKMRLAGTFILGGPGETAESIRETIEFSKELSLLYAHYYPLELYPGTPIYRSVLGNDQRLWFEKIMNDERRWGEIVYESENISATQLIEFVHSAYGCFYGGKRWKEIATPFLGNYYDGVWAVVKLWQKDRFRLGGKC